MGDSWSESGLFPQGLLTDDLGDLRVMIQVSSVVIIQSIQSTHSFIHSTAMVDSH